MRYRFRTSIAVVAFLAVVTAACGSSATAPPVRHTRPTAPFRYVAVGGTDATGNATDDPLLDAWPQQLFRGSMPLSAVFVNAAVPQETAAGATVDQVSTALTASPTVVTVWLVSGDLLAGTPPAVYATELRTLLAALRNGGRTTVLVGNSPPPAQMPGIVACQAGSHQRRLSCPAPVPDEASLDATVSAYNTAIAADAADVGAVVVDLHAAFSQAAAAGGPSVLDPTGADLSTAGSTLVARTFGAALSRTRSPG